MFPGAPVIRETIGQSCAVSLDGKHSKDVEGSQTSSLTWIFRLEDLFQIDLWELLFEKLKQVSSSAEINETHNEDSVEYNS